MIHDEESRPNLRAVGVSLLGMALVIGSLFLSWQRIVPPGAVILAGLARAHGSLTVSRNGFAVGVWQPLTLCAAGACATLLWSETGRTRMSLLAVQGACALGCLMIPIARFVALPGVLTALTGGALLLLGALDRYQSSDEREAGVRARGDDPPGLGHR